jgi:hypothetical protein
MAHKRSWLNCYNFFDIPRMYRINVEINPIKRYTIKNLRANSLVRDLKEELRKIDSLEPVGDCLRLRRGIQDELEDNDKLFTNSIRSGETLTAEKYFTKNHENLLGVELTQTSDCIAWDDSGEYRALMPCGHAADPNSLTNWAKYTFESGKLTLTCPALVGKTGTCNTELSFKDLKKLALLTLDECEYFEAILCENSIKNSLKIKQCPKCKTYIERVDLNDLKMECSVCKSVFKRDFAFCWQCDNEWVGGNGKFVESCGLPMCRSKDLEILSMCAYIKLLSCRDLDPIPSIRACPLCGKLAEHNGSGCKNIVCPKCNKSICFSCLKTTEVCLESSSHYGKCSVAPRQTEIRRPNND